MDWGCRLLLIGELLISWRARSRLRKHENVVPAGKATSRSVQEAGRLIIAEIHAKTVSWWIVVGKEETQRDQISRAGLGG